MKNKRRRNPNDQTKILLVAPPFVEPAHFPLGIAQLKSYIEQQISCANVSVIDLNIALFNDLAKEEFLGDVCDVCLRYFKKDTQQKQKIQEAFDHYGTLFARGSRSLRNKNSKEFCRASQYNFLNKIVLTFFQFCGEHLTSIFDDIIEGRRAFPKAMQCLFLERIKMMLAQRPALVGFSIFAQDQLPYALLLAQLLKKQTKIPIVFGGAFMPHIDTTSFLEIFRWVDFVIAREGEIGLTALIKHLKDKCFEQVPGLVYRKKNTIICNQEAFVKSLDNLPFPDVSEFDFKKYLLPVKAMPIIFSRGCSWKKCTFCTYHKNYPLSYKIKSIARCIQELKYFSARGIKYFMISDDTIPATHLNLLSSAIRKEKMRIFFGFITRPEKNFSFSVLENIYRAGGRYISWGVETSSQRILTLMNKGTKSSDVTTILNNARKIGFHNHCFMIKGFPTQTQREIYRDTAFLQKQHISAHMHNFRLLTGSFIFNNPRKFGIKILGKKPLYTVKGKSLYSSSVLFRCRNKLNWQEIEKRMNVLDTYFSHNLKSPSHLTVLIHASLRSLQKNEYQYDDNN